MRLNSFGFGPVVELFFRIVTQESGQTCPQLTWWSTWAAEPVVIGLG